MKKVPKEYPKTTSYYIQFTAGSKFQEEFLRGVIDNYFKVLATECKRYHKDNKVLVEKDT